MSIVLVLSGPRWAAMVSRLIATKLKKTARRPFMVTLQHGDVYVEFTVSLPSGMPVAGVPVAKSIAPWVMRVMASSNPTLRAPGMWVRVQKR